MIRHIIAAIATLLALWAMWYMYQLDVKAERFKKIHEIIEKTKMEVKIEKHEAVNSKPIGEPEAITEAPNAKKKEDELDKQLRALKERAGNMAAFKVSPLYKQKCSSCHGVNGEGIIGPRLIGKSSQEVYQALVDFKTGKRKNYVMYGLLSKMDDKQLKQLADEIGSFQQKLNEATK